MAKFDLRGWKYTGMSHEKRTTVLGLIWDPNDDTLSLTSFPTLRYHGEANEENYIVTSAKSI